jgi:uncharacterized tellurite resistance protein B-like protein
VNKKREEKLDSILDQLREASSEKDLKRFLANVSFQLDAIQRGYVSFRDAQTELVKQYPDMVNDELNKYKEMLFKFFAISPTENSAYLENSEQITANNENGNQNNQLTSFRNILNEVLKTDKGTKFYVMMRSSESSDSDQDEPSNEVSEEQATTEESNLDILSQVDKIHLKNYFVPINHVKDLRNM